MSSWSQRRPEIRTTCWLIHKFVDSQVQLTMQSIDRLNRKMAKESIELALNNRLIWIEKKITEMLENREVGGQPNWYVWNDRWFKVHGCTLIGQHLIWMQSKRHSWWNVAANFAKIERIVCVCAKCSLVWTRHDVDSGCRRKDGQKRSVRLMIKSNQKWNDEVSDEAKFALEWAAAFVVSAVQTLLCAVLKFVL